MTVSVDLRLSRRHLNLPLADGTAPFAVSPQARPCGLFHFGKKRVAGLPGWGRFFAVVIVTFGSFSAGHGHAM